MSQVRRPQHPNAALTPAHRLKMVRLVVEEGWSVSAVAQRFQVDDKTVRKWCDRYRAEGAAGLEDRSSRPRHSPSRTPEPLRRRVVELRCHSRRGAGFIAYATGMHASTVHRICVAEGLGRLDRGDRSTGPPTKPLRYERETPGEMVHVDVKKLPAIPDGGGWRTHGRGNAGPRQRAGWRYVHSAIDDRTRLGYSEIHTNATGATAAGFWLRAAAFYALCGIACERVLTDNGPCYRSSDFAKALEDTRTSPRRTRPYRPQTNGKVERFHRILNEEWAYARDWASDTQRCDAHQRFMHHYNEHRPHGALGWDTPMATLTRLNGDNVLGMHN